MARFRHYTWIITLVLVCGISYGQKTFRRSCDCEYMVDGKCAYTLLLPAGQGDGACPSDTDSGMGGPMSQEIQERFQELSRNFTELRSTCSGQAVMLNQLYSTLMDKILNCPLIQACTIPRPELNVNPPDVTVTMPQVDRSNADPTMPNIEVPTGQPEPMAPEFTPSEFGQPNARPVPTPGSQPMPTPGPVSGQGCFDICPDLPDELESIRMALSRMEGTSDFSSFNITEIEEYMRIMNETINSLTEQLLGALGGGGFGGLGGQAGAGQGTPGDSPAGQGGFGGFGNSGSDSQPGGSSGGNLGDLGPAILGISSFVNRLVESGSLCLRKGPLVAGERAFLPDASITASSVFNYQHVATRGRIYTEQEGDLMGAWCPENRSPTNAQGEPNTPGQEWIQFDLGRVRPVYGVVTRGRSDYPQWVTQYMVQYTDYINELDQSLTVWTPVRDLLGIDAMIFDGNVDQNTPRFHYFDDPIPARYFRIIPLSANEEGQNMCMRADIIGCVDIPSLF